MTRDEQLIRQAVEVLSNLGYLSEHATDQIASDVVATMRDMADTMEAGGDPAIDRLDTTTRYAVVRAHAGKQDQLAAYMPGNYEIVGRTAIGGSDQVTFLIAGRDVAGWTLDDYVIPRLASGMYFAEEIA